MCLRLAYSRSVAWGTSSADSVFLVTAQLIVSFVCAKTFVSVSCAQLSLAGFSALATLLQVLNRLRPKFDTMMRWYAGMAHQALKRKNQTTIHKFMKHKACSSAREEIASKDN